MATPLVSIILPSYNGSRYIRQSLDSCLAQTYTHFELILVNDCSTDDTLSIMEEYAARDGRIRVINNEFNKKLPMSLNTGFDRAQGTYFTWTSDDNYYAINALEALVQVLESRPGTDLVYTDYYTIDDNSKITGIRTFGDVNESFTRWLGAGACFLYRREIHTANNGYNPGAFLIEDYDFFVRAFMKFHFYYLQTPDLYYYREHAASLTATQSAAINDISKIFLERNLPGLEKKLPTEEVVLLYRKLAVHYSVTKNNRRKYLDFLEKTAVLSKKQMLLTVGYVLYKKTAAVAAIGLYGLVAAAGLLFKGKPKDLK